MLLDGERWKQADVPAEIQILVNKLEEGIVYMSELRMHKVTLELNQQLHVHVHVHVHAHAHAHVYTVPIFGCNRSDHKFYYSINIITLSFLHTLSIWMLV